MEIKSAREIGLKKAEEIAGKVSPEELQKLELEKKGKSLAHEYLGEKIDLKTLLKETGSNELVIRNIQLTLIESILLERSYDKSVKGILELEKINKKGNYKKYETMESILLQSLKLLQRQYKMSREQGFQQIKENIRENIKQTIEQVKQATPGVKVDVEKTVERTALNSNEWKSFITKFSSQFEDELNKLKGSLKDILLQ